MNVWSKKILLVFSLVLSSAAEAAGDAGAFFSQSLGDFSEELGVAADEGKKGIFLFFETDDCPFCARMKATILNQPDVQSFYQGNFLRFAVDAEGDLELTDFKGKTTIQKEFAKPFMGNRGATPVLAFVDLGGNLVVRYTGATRTKAEFLLLGKYYLDGKYTEMPFTKYKRSQR